MYIRKVCQFSYTVQLALWLEVFVLVLFVIFCFVFQDKWRNLSFSASGMGSRDKTRGPRTTGPSCSPLSTSQASSQASVAPVANKVAEAPPGAEKKQQEVKPHPKLVSHYFHTEV